MNRRLPGLSDHPTRPGFMKAFRLLSLRGSPSQGTYLLSEH